jgi:hypothetical protein
MYHQDVLLVQAQVNQVPNVGERVEITTHGKPLITRHYDVLTRVWQLDVKEVTEHDRELNGNTIGYSCDIWLEAIK